MARRKTHPGSIDKRGRSYRLRLCIGGKYETYNFSDVKRSEVETFAKKEHERLKKLHGRVKRGLPGVTTMSELITRFESDVLPGLAPNSAESYPHSLKPLAHFFVVKLRDPKLHDLDRGDVASYMAWRRTHGPSGERLSQPLSGRTIEKDRAILGLVFEKAVEWCLLDANPVRATKPPKYDKRQPVILNDDELDRLLAECEANPMLKTYVTVLAETGMRSKSEGLWLQWGDIDWEFGSHGAIEIVSGRHDHRTKSGKSRWVPITRRLRRALTEHASRYRFATYPGIGRTPWVFHHERRKKNAEAGTRPKSFRAAMSNACHRAKLPENFVPHDLRHRRVTNWLEAGKSPAIVQRAMGHADIQTTMSYYTFMKSHLLHLVENEPDERVELKELA